MCILETEENDVYKLRHTHADTITEIWGQGAPELFQNTKGRLYFNKFNLDTRKIELWQALNAGVYVKVIDENEQLISIVRATIAIKQKR